MANYNHVNHAKSIALEKLNEFKKVQKVDHKGLEYHANCKTDGVDLTIKNPVNRASAFLTLSPHSQSQGTPNDVCSAISLEFDKLGVVKK